MLCLNPLRQGQSLLDVQEKTEQRAHENAVRQSQQGAPAPRRSSGTVAVFAVLVRYRQACIHHSLLPSDIQPLPTDSSSGDEELVELETAFSHAEGLERILAKHTPSTKLKHVLRIIQVTLKPLVA